MKTNIFSVILPIFIVATLIISCGDNSKGSKDAQRDLRETNQQIDQRAEEIRVETRQDWENFKAASNEALDKSEKEIQDLRVKIAKADKKQREKLNKELDELEKRNKTLRERIETRSNTIKDDLSNLNDKAIEDHRAAQRELKHDMDALGKSIGDFFKNNKN